LAPYLLDVMLKVNQSHYRAKWLWHWPRPDGKHKLQCNPMRCHKWAMNYSIGQLAVSISIEIRVLWFYGPDGYFPYGPCSSNPRSSVRHYLCHVSHPAFESMLEIAYHHLPSIGHHGIFPKSLWLLHGPWSGNTVCIFLFFCLQKVWNTSHFVAGCCESALVFPIILYLGETPQLDAISFKQNGFQKVLNNMSQYLHKKRYFMVTTKTSHFEQLES
jgi:hypothetical protein